MLKYRIVLAAAIAAMVLCESCCQAGPARSLASVVTARAAKIPRSIRAPFRNTEMMTARGFGKRSQAYRDDVDTPWSPGKPNHSYSEETYGNELAENTLDSVSIDSLVHELTGNAAVLRSILERIVDANHDGQISPAELSRASAPSFPLNEIY